MRLDDSYQNKVVSFDHGDDWIAMIQRWLEWLGDLGIDEIDERLPQLYELFEFAVDDVQYKEELFDELEALFNEIAPEGYVFGLHPKHPFYGFFQEVD